MSLSTIKMTARQFLQLGEDPPGVRLELVDGEIVVSPSPIPNHSFVVLVLARILGNHIDSHDLGQLFTDVDTIFGEHDVRRPDLLFFQKSRLHLVGDKAMEGPPDLCVEVLSPGNEKSDRKEKFNEYRKGGVAFYWMVDPAGRTIEGYRLEDGQYILIGKGSNSEIVRLAPFEQVDIPLSSLWRKGG